MRKVFLDDLPKCEGIGKNKGKMVVDWKKSIGYKVPFVYDDIEGEIEIINYDRKYLYIKYLDVQERKMKARDFSQCKLGKLLGKYTNEFRYEIGKSFKDDKRDLIITDREYRVDKGRNKRCYKYTCNVCKWTEGWVAEHHLKEGKGCSCCSGKTVVSYINSIWAKTPWMIDLGVSEEDAKNRLPQSNKPIEVICPNCNNKKIVSPNSINRDKTIHCSCSRNNSYPERFVTCFLTMLGIKFKTQLTCKDFEWCDKYRYDFYLPDHNCIVEVHGLQHYEETTMCDLAELKITDKMKKIVAKQNVDNYVELDCRKSDMEWIKDSILNSSLVNILDLSNIDWNKCEELAWSNLTKEICDYWNNKECWENAVTIAKDNRWGIKSRDTIVRHLKKGVELGWCNYDPKEELRRSKSDKAGKSKKKVKVYKDNIYIGTFESISFLAKNSEDLLGVKVSFDIIRRRLDKNDRLYKKEYKNYKFEEEKGEI